MLIEGRVRVLWEKFKLYLDKTRNKNPQVFDWFSKFGVYIFSFLTSFMSVLSLPTWGLFLIIFFSFSMTLAFQWVALTNSKEQSLVKLREEYEDKIKRIRLNYDSNILITLLAKFSCTVSHKVKDIVSRMPITPDAKTAALVADFFNESLNQMENILSVYYGEEIRASIKLNSSNSAFKTYGRGKNNIKSRGGQTKIAILNQVSVEIKRNYAYDMIIKNHIPYFAESDLTHMKNKAKEDDVFYCEYDNYLDLFCSTIIVSLTYPVFERNSENVQNYEILGILCIDCAKCMPEWLDNDITSSLIYLIISDYVDSLCILIKKYSDGMKRHNEKQTKTKKKSKNL